MEAVAKTKYLKGSPQKTRLVIDLVRGKNVSKALAILQYTNKRAAGPIAKCIHSAIANATYKAEQENIAIDPDDLWVKRCFVDMGPTKNRRRLRPAPQGRAYFERRHYCHITIELTSDAPEETAEEGPSKEQLAKIEAKKAKKAAESKLAADEKKAAGKESTEEAVEAATAEQTPDKEASASDTGDAVEEKADAPIEEAVEEKAGEEADEKAEPAAKEKAEEPAEVKADEDVNEIPSEKEVEEKADEPAKEKADEKSEESAKPEAEDESDSAADEKAGDTEEEPEDK